MRDSCSRPADPGGKSGEGGQRGRVWSGCPNGVQFVNTGSHSRAYGNWRKKGLPAMATGAYGSLVIQSPAKPRAGWAAAFAEMAAWRRRPAGGSGADALG